MTTPTFAEETEWFFGLVGSEAGPRHVPLRGPAHVADGNQVRWLVAVPVLVPLQVALLESVHIAVSGRRALLATLIAVVLLARSDARTLAAQGIDAPSPLLALLPPLYLQRRARVARHPIPAYGAALAVAAGLLLAATVDPALAPAPLRSSAVQGLLYQRVLDWQIPLDPGTAVIRCPAFTQTWVGQQVRCTGRDAQRALAIEVTPQDHAGHVRWRVVSR